MTPYQIHIGDEVLADLHRRLDATRLPNEIDGIGWEQGTPRPVLSGLLDAWRHRYDWRRTEARLNRYEQLVAEVDGQGIHLIHVRSSRSSAPAVMITHGWPGSVTEFLDVIDSLSEYFHLILPSLPGFAFSGPTSQRGWHPRRIAAAFVDVAEQLGYRRFGVQGGDWGSVVSTNIADLVPDRVVGLHLNMVVARSEPGQGSDPRAAEFRATGVGYQEIQGTKPQSLGYGLEDSPAGLAGWIVEKFQAWSHGELSEAFTAERLLDNITAYWVTGTATSSLRIYWEMRQAGRSAMPTQRIGVPTAVAMFPGEIFYPPRPAIEAAYNVVRWSQPERGGHFAAMEAPVEFATDVIEFFSEVAP